MSRHSRAPRRRVCAIRAEPFGGQSEPEFQAMKDDINRTADLVQESGGEVVRNPAESEGLARELDNALPPKA